MSQQTKPAIAPLARTGAIRAAHGPSPRGSPSPSRPSSALPAHVQKQPIEVVDMSTLPPPPSALSSRTNTSYDPYRDAPSPLQDFPDSAPTAHQRTLTGTFLDNLNRATATIQQHTSRPASPIKSLASFIPARSTLESSASQPKIRALQNWFHDSSARVRLGRATQHEDPESGSEAGEEYDSEIEDDEEEKNNTMANMFNRSMSIATGFGEHSRRRGDLSPSPTRHGRRHSVMAPSPAGDPRRPSATSKFSWLLSTQKNTTTHHPRREPIYHDEEDELLELNISQALFPHGPADSLAPSSLHHALTNAEALIARYQRSYRQLSTSLVDSRAETSAQEDELDEADTRVRHLKMQLETMAARANEQDAQMQKLMQELADERKAKKDEHAAHKRSLSLNTAQATDVDTTPRRRHRTSNSEVSVDSGFESESEADAASVFSDCTSPTSTKQSSVLDSDSFDTTPRNKLQTQRTVSFEEATDVPAHAHRTRGGWGCSNCEGGAQAAVWGRLAKEREENRSLRHQVEVLEEAVDGALNVVAGAWGM